MSALAELVAVLAALHVALGLHWFPRSAYVFRALLGARASAIPASRTWGSDRMALAFGPPLPGTGRFFLVELRPLSFGDDVAVASSAHDPNPGGRTPRNGRVVAWSEARTARAESRRVLVGGTLLVATGSDALARHLAATLRTLGALGPRERAAEIEALEQRALDESLARARVDAWQREARRLRWPAVATFVFLFGVVPVTGVRPGFALAWPWLALALAALQAWGGVAFFRAHRRVEPSQRGERAMRTATVALSPVEALRSAEVLGRDLLATFHPFAAGAVLLERTEFELFAERVLRDALHPMPPAQPHADPRATEAERAARERTARCLAAAARRLGLRDDLATCAPAGDADERAYCPRCLQTFVLEAGTCTECWDVPLAPLASAPPRRDALSSRA